MMRHAILGGLLIGGTAALPAAAQPGAPPPASPQAAVSPATTAPARTPLAGGTDFISPMGEPVHSEDKLSGAEHWFAQTDADHDGRLTLAEFRADAARFFRRLDTDRNGEIGPAEIEHYEVDIAPEIRVVSTGFDYVPSGDDSTPKPAYPDHLGAGRMSYIDLPEPVAAIDTNFDRGISVKEYEQATARRFAQLDLNSDGAITRDELPKLSSSFDEDRPRRGKGGGGGRGGGGHRRGGGGGGGGGWGGGGGR